MRAEFSVTFEGDHVKVVSVGDKSMDVARRVWTEVAEVCQQHDCYHVLGLALSETPLSIVDGYSHAELFRELGITARYRIAWVEQDRSAREVIEFTETVLVNRGLPGRLFTTEEQALKWLRDQGQR